MDAIEKGHKVTAQSYVLDTVDGSSTPKYDIDDPSRDAVFGERKEGQVNYRSVGW
jgi:hypothetical protein